MVICYSSDKKLIQSFPPFPSANPGCRYELNVWCTLMKLHSMLLHIWNIESRRAVPNVCNEVTYSKIFVEQISEGPQASAHGVPFILNVLLLLSWLNSCPVIKYIDFVLFPPRNWLIFLSCFPSTISLSQLFVHLCDYKFVRAKTFPFL